MNAEIYTGPNRVENWLIAQRTAGSPLRDFTRKSNPEKIVVDDKSTMTAIKDAKVLTLSVVNFDSTKYEDVGGLIGAAVFGGIYAITYPVTFIDGPLPFVDAAWAYGALRFMRSGHAIGGEIGSWFD